VTRCVMVIWKYELKITDRQKVRMPVVSDLLSVANQRGSLCLWAMVDPANANTVERDIEIIGTGNPMPDGRRTFIGSAVIDPFVWHVFERFE